MKHLMLDIETLDTKSHAAVLSIAAIVFDLNTGEKAAKFYGAATIKSNLDLGLNVNPQTALWWVQQEDALKFWVDSKKKSITEVLEDLEEFILINFLGGQEFFIWGNSNRFDMGILDNAYTKAGWTKLPWNFRGERDVRTLTGFIPEIKEEHVKAAKLAKLELHNPLVDCELQIEYCCETWKRISILPQISNTNK